MSYRELNSSKWPTRGQRLIAATKAVALASAVIWGLLFALLVVLTGGSLGGVPAIAVAQLTVPLAITALSIWLAFFRAAEPTKVILAIELVLLACGVFWWMIVAAAGGG